MSGRGALEKAATTLHNQLIEAHGRGFGLVGVDEQDILVYVFNSQDTWKGKQVTQYNGFKVRWTFDFPRPDHFKGDFATWQERDAWILKNADYFTVVRFHGRNHHLDGHRGKAAEYERHECPTLREAEALAKRLKETPGRPFMIYAVSGTHDAYVKTIK